MTENEMKKLSRADLLELLLQERKENESLRAEIENLKQKLDDHILKIKKAGSIAEASLQLNGVFDAAQKAASQYLENIRAIGDRYKKNCEKMMKDTEAKCRSMENRLRSGGIQRPDDVQRPGSRSEYMPEGLPDDMRKSRKQFAEAAEPLRGDNDAT